MKQRDATLFHEEQRIGLGAAAVVLGAAIAAAIVAAVGWIAGAAEALLVAAAVGAALAAALMFRLLMVITDLNEDALSVRGGLATRRLPLRDIVHHGVASMTEVMGYGHRIALGGGTGFVARGTRGVEVRSRDGTRVLIGSQRAEELDRALDAAIRDAQGADGRIAAPHDR